MTRQRDTTTGNAENVQGVSKGKKSGRLPKSHQDYWASRLYQNSYTWNGRRVELPEYSVKIQFAGRRFTFNLGSRNRDIAATKARNIYLSLLGKGWDATLAEFSPRTLTLAAHNEQATVGEFLAEVGRTSQLQPKTFARYAQYFRMIVAHIRNFDAGVAKYDWTAGRKEWLTKIESTPLSAITPAAAADWKAAYLARAGDDHQQKVQVRRAFNTALRSAKSLFSTKVIHQPNFGVRVPTFKVQDAQFGEKEIYWFGALSFEKPGSMKFHPPAGVSYESLVVAARRELRDKWPEAYLLFLLCACAGLRRSEADVLLWNQIVHVQNVIRIEVTPFIQPKHDSCGPVAIDPALCKELLSFKAKATSAFVVNSPRKWEKKNYVWYRCEVHWRTLMDWLATKGITAEKKNHELRKFFGDAVTRIHGIYSASAQLRHASVQMTEKHYADRKGSTAVPMKGLLSEAPIRGLRRQSRSKKQKKIRTETENPSSKIGTAVSI